MRFHIRLLIAIAGASLLGGPSALAETLADPTRPPAEIENPGVDPVSDGLQSIIRREKGKPAAIINGEYVELGGKVGDATVVRIGDDSVTLRGPAGTETLKLMPGIEKTPRRAEKKPRASHSDRKVNK